MECVQSVACLRLHSAIQCSAQRGMSSSKDASGDVSAVAFTAVRPLTLSRGLPQTLSCFALFRRKIFHDIVGAEEGKRLSP